jgi:hypothetical protein
MDEPDSLELFDSSRAVEGDSIFIKNKAGKLCLSVKYPPEEAIATPHRLDKSEANPLQL